jgi:micrococcal nuclease
MSRRVRRRLIIAIISAVILLAGAWQSVDRQGTTNQQPTNESYADKLNPTPEPATDVKGAQAPPPEVTPPPTIPQEQPVSAGQRTGPHRVVSVSDGDTFRVEIDGTRQTVRLIGVDTPEVSRPNTPVQCYARQASAFTKSLLDSSFVYLQPDSRTDDKDRYGRILRYAYLTDERDVQAELLRGGYAFAYTRFPFSRSEEFVALQLEAQTARLGVWRDCTPVLGANGTYSTGPAD